MRDRPGLIAPLWGKTRVGCLKLRYFKHSKNPTGALRGGLER